MGRKKRRGGENKRKDVIVGNLGIIKPLRGDSFLVDGGGGGRTGKEF